MAKRLTPTTGREIREVFRIRGIKPKKSLGQNFLVDANLLDVVANAAEPSPEDLILEIGAGTGALTEVLGKSCGQVIAVEKDEYLCRIAQESFAETDNVSVISSDIMGDNDDIAPIVVKAIRAALEDRPNLHFKVAGDLPYSVSTPVLRALAKMTPLPQLIAVTVQAEVGDRLTASPGSKSFGFLTVLIQSACEVREVRKLPPWVYWPRPKIWTSLLTIQPKPELIASLPPEEAIKKAAGALFEHRRKTAANALMMGGLAEKREDAVALLERVGADADRRADNMSINEILELARIVSDSKTESP